MKLRNIAHLAGAVGGLCWIVRLPLDAADLAQAALDPLRWVGLGLVAIALAGAGTGLVSKSAVWLRVIVGVALPALVWSVLEVVRAGGDALVVDAIVGAAVLAVSVIGLRRNSRAVNSHSGSRGHSRTHSH